MQMLNKILVIHGLTATPHTMQPLIDRLREAEFDVTAPLLPGHGTTHEDLADKKWQEWWGAVKTDFETLAGDRGKILVAGLSLGSLLALRLAEEFPEQIVAVAAIGTPLELPRLIEDVAYPAMKYTPLKYLFRFSKKDFKRSVLDPDGRDYYIKNSYPVMPVSSVMELFKFKKIVAGDLHKISAPTLIVHARKDHVAPIANVAILERSLKNRDTLILENSGHVVTLDSQRETASKAIVAFFKKFS